MDSRWLLWTVRALLLCALAVSAALLVDYASTSPAFCSPGSGCDSVRRSGLGYIPIPVVGSFLPVPMLGLLGFGLAYAVTLLPDWRKRRRWSLALLSAGAFVGLGLLVAQAVWIGQFCWLCVVVDLAALGAFGAALALPRDGWETTSAEELGRRAQPLGLHPAGWALLGGVAVLAPWLWPKLKPTPPVPAKVAAYYAPGKINVVEFADFQCPFCRRLHTQLKHIIEDYPGRVNFVRLHMPLASHAHARPAARAAVCAAQQGKQEAMADRLFEAESLEQESLLLEARGLALDMAAFERCLEDTNTERLIDEQASILREAGFQGLPTTFVGAEKIIGAQPEEVFRDAFEKAASGDGQNGIPGWLYWPLVGLVTLGVVWGARLRPVRGGRPETP